MMKNKYLMLLVVLGFFISEIQKFDVYLNSNIVGSMFYVMQFTLFLPSTISNIFSEIFQAPSAFLFLAKYILSFIFAFLILLPFKKNFQSQ